MDFEKIVDAILNKEPVFYVSNNIDEIRKEKEIIKSKLDEFYVDGSIDENFHHNATQLIDNTYNSQIQKLNSDIEASNLRFGMSYVRDLTGNYPSIYSNISGTLGENAEDAKLKIAYKNIDTINEEREQCITLLYEQYTSGKINNEELREREDKINLVYDNLIQSLSSNQSKKM
mgnify:CR=1 FL=1